MSHKYNSGKRSAKIKSTIRTLCALGLGLTVLGTANAGGPPLLFDGYTVTNGTITTGCPLIGGVQPICEQETVSDGMLQRRVTLPSGVNAGSYIQFILTESGVSGDATASPFSAARGSLNFTNEDFVKINNRLDGIASKNTIIESNFTDPTTEERFVNVQEFSFGWALNTANPWIVAHQEITVLDYSTTPLSPTALLDNVTDITSSASGFNTTLNVSIQQMVDLSDSLGAGVQKFQYKKVSGFYQQTARIADGTLLPGGTNGGDIDWANGDALEAMWVGQRLDSVPLNGALFGYTRYTNLDLGITTSLTSLTNPNATNWLTATFGAAMNVLDTPKIFTPTAVVTAPTALLPTIAAAPADVVPIADVVLPIGYDAWTVSNGVFTVAACPQTAALTCLPPIVNEQGTFQRYIVVNGVHYIHTIVTDSSATGDPTLADFTVGSLAFKNESIILPNAATSGIANKLHLAEQNNATPTGVTMDTHIGEFRYDVEIKTGWAHGGRSDTRFKVDQQLTVKDNANLHASSLDDKFYMERGGTQEDVIIKMSAAVGTNLSSDVNVPQQTLAVPLSTCLLLAGTGWVWNGTTCILPASTIAGSGFLDPIMFQTEIVAGAYQTTAHALDPFNPLLPSNGGDIAWISGDALQATWVGGNYTTSDPSGTSTVGVTNYTNLSTGDQTGFVSMDNPAPDSWVNPFSSPPPVYQSTYTP